MVERLERTGEGHGFDPRHGSCVLKLGTKRHLFNSHEFIIRFTLFWCFIKKKKIAFDIVVVAVVVALVVVVFSLLFLTLF